MSNATYDQHGIMGTLMGYPGPEEQSEETLEGAIRRSQSMFRPALEEMRE